MSETDTIKREVIKCSNCYKEIKPDEDGVIQIRIGYLAESGEFFPDHDVGYYCNKCWILQ